MIYALGFGSRTTAISMITSWFDIHLRARLYSTILITELVGMIIGEPLLQNVLAVAVRLPRIWQGLSFFVCGVRGHAIIGSIRT
jgi:hypothetical protein